MPNSVEITFNPNDSNANNESLRTEGSVSLENETVEDSIRPLTVNVQEDELTRNKASTNSKETTIIKEDLTPKRQIDKSFDPINKFEKKIHPENSNLENTFSVVFRKEQGSLNLNDRSVNQEEKSVENSKESEDSKRGSQLRFPSSPHFPAIGENQVNERHQNYTVIRSGDIIEKNGTYYSADGTVRGYSGTVRKIANSKTLSEIFARQKELELKEQDSLQKLKMEEHGLKSQLDVKNPPNFVKHKRISLGNIIENEKRTNNKSSPNFKRYSETKPVVQTIESELSKKLEDRRLLIENNLKVDTNQISPGSAISSNSSNSFTVSSDLSNPSLMSPTSDTQTTSATSFCFDQGLSRSAHNQQKSPSFVLSAKNKINHGSKSLLDSVHQNRNNLLNELKMTVPLLEESKCDHSNSKNSLIQVVTTKTEPEKSSSTKRHNEPKKFQAIGERDNLMDAIKSFSLTSLRRIGSEIQ